MQLKQYNAGFTMLEVLITMVILSIGLLGLAGMQANGLKSNHLAYVRSQATLLAYDMSDRMRSNMAGVEAGSYNDLSGDPATGGATSPDCETSVCSPATMASYDYFKWSESMANNLPKGEGAVSAAAGIFTITVMWDDDKKGTGTDCSANADPDENLKCFQIELQL